MSTTYYLGKFAGLKVSARRTVLLAMVLLWAALAVLAIWVIRLPVLGAILGSLAAALLHFVSEFWHHVGHAIAARMTGHPMTGVLFWGPLATSIYPPKEKKLSAEIHVRRALGGPLASLVLASFAGLITLALGQSSGTIWWVAFFLFLDNLLVFTLGALLPLGFNDGSTLWFWWKRRSS